MHASFSTGKSRRAASRRSLIPAVDAGPIVVRLPLEFLSVAPRLGACRMPLVWALDGGFETDCSPTARNDGLERPRDSRRHQVKLESSVS